MDFNTDSSYDSYDSDQNQNSSLFQPEPQFQLSEDQLKAICLEQKLKYSIIKKQINFLQGKGYILINLIGTGGEGSVFKAFSIYDNVYRAIKAQIMNHQQEDNEQINEEQQVFMKLKGSNSTVQLIQTLEDEDANMKYLVLEYFDLNLKEYLQQQPLKTVEQKLKLMIQLAESLVEIHKLGVFHSDIKPENILIKIQNKQIKFTDFGVSKVAEKTIINNVKSGTFKYIAPEVISYEEIRQKQTKKIDCWSIGVVFLEIILERQIIMEEATKLRKGQFAFPKENQYQKLYKKIVQRCLKIEVAERPNAQEIYMLLSSYIILNCEQHFSEIEKFKVQFEKNVQLPDFQIKNNNHLLFIQNSQSLEQYYQNRLKPQNTFQQELQSQTRNEVTQKNIQANINLDNFVILKNNKIASKYQDSFYLAQCSITHQKLIVREIPQYDDGTWIQFLMDEIEILNKISGEYILKFLGFKVKDNCFYLFLEYCDEINLLEYIKKNQLNLTQIVQIFYKICLGYKLSIFNKNILHTDIQPSNIYIKDNNPKITGFHFSSYQANILEKSQKQRAGTPLYQSPQKLLSEFYSCYSYKDDIYSLGICLFQMLYLKNHNNINNVTDLRKFLKSLQAYGPRKALLIPQETRFPTQQLKIVNNLIFQMIEFEEEKRISIDDLIKEIEQVLKLL